MAENQIIARYQQYRGYVETSPVHQYDYGQKLILDNFPGLPDTFEVHFSNDQKSGKAITVIGTNYECAVPDACLIKGLDIWAWLFLHEGKDDGQTVYTIKIPVIRRPGISVDPPTPVEQSVIEQLIAAMNEAVQRAEDAAEAAEEHAGDSQLIEDFENGNLIFDDGMEDEDDEEGEDDNG